MKIFVAGATGAIGLPLVRALCTLGHEVTGMTRGKRGIDPLRELGVAASIADAFDPAAIRTAIAAAAPDVVIDQLSSLPANPAEILKCIPDDTRLHRDGGGNLLTFSARFHLDCDGRPVQGAVSYNSTADYWQRELPNGALVGPTIVGGSGIINLSVRSLGQSPLHIT